MPKIKTHRGAAKSFGVTKNGRTKRVQREKESSEWADILHLQTLR